MDESGDRGTESALRYLKSQVDAERDSIYLHAALDEPAQLYPRMLGWYDAPVLTGHRGSPVASGPWKCVPRMPNKNELTSFPSLTMSLGKERKGVYG
jgi:hypothetical protein